MNEDEDGSVSAPIPTARTGKFTVERTDGSSCAGGKHEHCEYFVLDWLHDKFAVPAALAYAKACEREYPQLASDLRDQAGAAVARTIPARTDPLFPPNDVPDCGEGGVHQPYCRHAGKPVGGSQNSAEPSASADVATAPPGFRVVGRSGLDVPMKNGDWIRRRPNGFPELVESTTGWKGAAWGRGDFDILERVDALSQLQPAITELSSARARIAELEALLSVEAKVERQAARIAELEREQAACVAWFRAYCRNDDMSKRECLTGMLSGSPPKTPEDAVDTESVPE